MKRTLGRPGHRWEDNVKRDLKEIGCDLGIQDLVNPITTLGSTNYRQFLRIQVTTSCPGSLLSYTLPEV